MKAGEVHARDMAQTFEELWLQSVQGTPWATLDLSRELRNVEKHAVRPRIPSDHLVFRVFRAFKDPKKQIKVVLLGQDPYPEMLKIVDELNSSQTPLSVSRACGFSFSSPHGGLPVSLRKMFVEILREFPKDAEGPASEYSGDLSYLISEGVFLVNTLLTVHYDGTRGKSDSHTSWEAFTTQILGFVRRTCPKAVFLSLGKKAADVLKDSGVTDPIHVDHPANRSVGRNPFVGSNIFLQANERLMKRGLEPVDWVPMRKAVDTKYYEFPIEESDTAVTSDDD